MQLLPRDQWIIEPIAPPPGSPINAWYVGAWAQDGYRVFALASPVDAGPPPPPVAAGNQAKWPAGLPTDFEGIRVLDLDSGQEVADVISVNADKGKLVRLKTDGAGNYVINPANGRAEEERLQGRFRLLE